MHKNILVATEKELNMYIEKIGVDMLFECFAGLILDSNKIDLDKIHIIPFESFKRNYKNDLLEAPNDFDDNAKHFLGVNELSLVQLYTSRSGILDYLPEDFYAEPDNDKAKLDEDGQRKGQREIQEHRERIKELKQSALRFFRPLEISFNQVRVQRELSEVRLVEDKDPILQKLWNKKNIQATAWKRFYRTLHLSRYIIGDMAKTKALIEYVLETPVTLTYQVESQAKVSQSEIQKHTGKEMILGFNIISGNAIYDYLEICVLRIENLNKKNFYNYYNQDSDTRKLVDNIVKHYFPLNVEVRLDFKMEDVAKDKEEVAIPVIGYSIVLGKPL